MITENIERNLRATEKIIKAARLYPAKLTAGDVADIEAASMRSLIAACRLFNVLTKGDVK